MAHGGNVPDGRTDDIPAMLSQGEYVMDAETVALLHLAKETRSDSLYL